MNLANRKNLLTILVRHTGKQDSAMLIAVTWEKVAHQDVVL